MESKVLISTTDQFRSPKAHTSGYPSPFDAFIGNMVCNPYFNNELCEWDGGDCCFFPVDLNACTWGSDCRCHFTGKLSQQFQESKLAS